MAFSRPSSSAQNLSHRANNRRAITAPRLPSLNRSKIVASSAASLCICHSGNLTPIPELRSRRSPPDVQEINAPEIAISMHLSIGQVSTSTRNEEAAKPPLMWEKTDPPGIVISMHLS